METDKIEIMTERHKYAGHLYLLNTKGIYANYTRASFTRSNEYMYISKDNSWHSVESANILATMRDMVMDSVDELYLDYIFSEQYYALLNKNIDIVVSKSIYHKRESSNIKIEKKNKEFYESQNKKVSDDSIKRYSTRYLLSHRWGSYSSLPFSQEDIYIELSTREHVKDKKSSKQLRQLKAANNKGNAKCKNK